MIFSENRFPLFRIMLSAINRRHLLPSAAAICKRHWGGDPIFRNILKVLYFRWNRRINEPMAAAETIGLILAGGRARRMGGQDKAFLPLAGGNLAQRAIARLAPQCDHLIINANRELDRFAGFGVPVISDSVAGYAGPLAGILTGLDWLADHAPDAALLTVPVDGPFFPDDLGARLRAAAKSQGVAIACAQSGGRRHGVYGLFSAALRDDLRRALTIEGIRKVDDWLDRHNAAVAEWSTEPVDPFFNVNTSDELARAEQYLRALANKS
jgi:molybdenum cofactor guanylyltransferase